MCPIRVCNRGEEWDAGCRGRWPGGAGQPSKVPGYTKGDRIRRLSGCWHDRASGREQVDLDGVRLDELLWYQLRSSVPVIFLAPPYN